MIGKLNILLVTAVLLAAFAVIAADRDAQRPADPRQTEAVSTVGDAAGLQVAAATTSASRVIPFQGLLTDLSDSPVTIGSCDLVLSLYDAASGGTLLWTETQPAVAVSGGRFSVQLGAVTSLDDPDGDPETNDAVSFDQPRYLGIAVDPPGPDPLGPEMTPRKEIVPAVFAHEAGDAATVGGYTPGELMPVGVIVPFAGETPPTGWLMCDGAEVSRATYADLYAVIGNAYGNGDGSTTFNLPNLVSRFPYGSLADGSNRGQTGGADQHDHGVTGYTKNHALIPAELPSHAHSVMVGTCGFPERWGTPNCADGRFWWSRDFGTYCNGCDNPPRTTDDIFDVEENEPHKHEIEIQTLEVNHLPSYTVVNYIIKY